jgi:hypothetical protein
MMMSTERVQGSTKVSDCIVLTVDVKKDGWTV